MEGRRHASEDEFQHDVYASAATVVSTPDASGKQSQCDYNYSQFQEEDADAFTENDDEKDLTDAAEYWVAGSRTTRGIVGTTAVLWSLAGFVAAAAIMLLCSFEFGSVPHLPQIPDAKTDNVKEEHHLRVEPPGAPVTREGGGRRHSGVDVLVDDGGGGEGGGKGGRGNGGTSENHGSAGGDGPGGKAAAPVFEGEPLPNSPLAAAPLVRFAAGARAPPASPFTALPGLLRGVSSREADADPVVQEEGPTFGAIPSAAARSPGPQLRRPSAQRELRAPRGIEARASDRQRELNRADRRLVAPEGTQPRPVPSRAAHPGPLCESPVAAGAPPWLVPAEADASGRAGLAGAAASLLPGLRGGVLPVEADAAPVVQTPGPAFGARRSIAAGGVPQPQLRSPAQFVEDEPPRIGARASDREREPNRADRRLVAPEGTQPRPVPSRAAHPGPLCESPVAAGAPPCLVPAEADASGRAGLAGAAASLLPGLRGGVSPVEADAVPVVQTPGPAFGARPSIGAGGVPQPQLRSPAQFVEDEPRVGARASDREREPNRADRRLAAGAVAQTGQPQPLRPPPASGGAHQGPLSASPVGDISAGRHLLARPRGGAVADLPGSSGPPRLAAGGLAPSVGETTTDAVVDAPVVRSHEVAVPADDAPRAPRPALRLPPLSLPAAAPLNLNRRERAFHQRLQHPDGMIGFPEDAAAAAGAARSDENLHAGQRQGHHAGDAINPETAFISPPQSVPAAQDSLPRATRAVETVSERTGEATAVPDLVTSGEADGVNRHYSPLPLRAPAAPNSLPPGSPPSAKSRPQLPGLALGPVPLPAVESPSFRRRADALSRRPISGNVGLPVAPSGGEGASRCGNSRPEHATADISPPRPQSAALDLLPGPLTGQFRPTILPNRGQHQHHQQPHAEPADVDETPCLIPSQLPNRGQPHHARTAENNETPVPRVGRSRSPSRGQQHHPEAADDEDELIPVPRVGRSRSPSRGQQHHPEAADDEDELIPVPRDGRSRSPSRGQQHHPEAADDEDEVIPVPRVGRSRSPSSGQQHHPEAADDEDELIPVPRVGRSRSASRGQQHHPEAADDGEELIPVPRVGRSRSPSRGQQHHPEAADDGEELIPASRSRSPMNRRGQHQQRHAPVRGGDEDEELIPASRSPSPNQDRQHQHEAGPRADDQDQDSTPVPLSSREVAADEDEISDEEVTFVPPSAHQNGGGPRPAQDDLEQMPQLRPPQVPADDEEDEEPEHETPQLVRPGADAEHLQRGHVHEDENYNAPTPPPPVAENARDAPLTDDGEEEEEPTPFDPQSAAAVAPELPQSGSEVEDDNPLLAVPPMDGAQVVTGATIANDERELVPHPSMETNTSPGKAKRMGKAATQQNTTKGARRSPLFGKSTANSKGKAKGGRNRTHELPPGGTGGGGRVSKNAAAKAGGKATGAEQEAPNEGHKGTRDRVSQKPIGKAKAVKRSPKFDKSSEAAKRAAKGAKAKAKRSPGYRQKSDSVEQNQDTENDIKDNEVVVRPARPPPVPEEVVDHFTPLNFPRILRILSNREQGAPDGNQRALDVAVEMRMSGAPGHAAPPASSLRTLLLGPGNPFLPSTSCHRDRIPGGGIPHRVCAQHWGGVQGLQPFKHCLQYRFAASERFQKMMLDYLPQQGPQGHQAQGETTQRTSATPKNYLHDRDEAEKVHEVQSRVEFGVEGGFLKRLLVNHATGAGKTFTMIRMRSALARRKLAQIAQAVDDADREGGVRGVVGDTDEASQQVGRRRSRGQSTTTFEAKRAQKSQKLAKELLAGNKEHQALAMMIFENREQAQNFMKQLLELPSDWRMELLLTEGPEFDAVRQLVLQNFEDAGLQIKGAEDVGRGWTRQKLQEKFETNSSNGAAFLAAMQNANLNLAQKWKLKTGREIKKDERTRRGAHAGVAGDDEDEADGMEDYDDIEAEHLSDDTAPEPHLPQQPPREPEVQIAGFETLRRALRSRSMGVYRTRVFDTVPQAVGTAADKGGGFTAAARLKKERVTLQQAKEDVESNWVEPAAAGDDPAAFRSELINRDDVAVFVDEAHLLLEPVSKEDKVAKQGKKMLIAVLRHYALKNPLYLFTATPKKELLDVVRGCRRDRVVCSSLAGDVSNGISGEQQECASAAARLERLCYSALPELNARRHVATLLLETSTVRDSNSQGRALHLQENDLPDAIFTRSLEQGSGVGDLQMVGTEGFVSYYRPAGVAHAQRPGGGEEDDATSLSSERSGTNASSSLSSSGDSLRARSVFGRAETFAAALEVVREDLRDPADLRPIEDASATSSTPATFVRGSFSPAEQEWKESVLRLQARPDALDGEPLVTPKRVELADGRVNFLKVVVNTPLEAVARQVSWELGKNESHWALPGAGSSAGGEVEDPVPAGGSEVGDHSTTASSEAEEQDDENESSDSQTAAEKAEEQASLSRSADFTMGFVKGPAQGHLIKQGVLSANQLAPLSSVLAPKVTALATHLISRVQEEAMKSREQVMQDGEDEEVDGEDGGAGGGPLLSRRSQQRLRILVIVQDKHMVPRVANLLRKVLPAKLTVSRIQDDAPANWDSERKRPPAEMDDAQVQVLPRASDFNSKVPLPTPPASSSSSRVSSSEEGSSDEQLLAEDQANEGNNSLTTAPGAPLARTRTPEEEEEESSGYQFGAGVLVGSAAKIGTGEDFKALREIHVLEVPRAANLIQYFGRGPRNGAHASLPESERDVQNFLYVARLPKLFRLYLASAAKPKRQRSLFSKLLFQAAATKSFTGFNKTQQEQLCTRQPLAAETWFATHFTRWNTAWTKFVRPEKRSRLDADLAASVRGLREFLEAGRASMTWSIAKRPTFVPRPNTREAAELERRQQAVEKAKKACMEALFEVEDEGSEEVGDEGDHDLQEAAVVVARSSALERAERYLAAAGVRHDEDDMHVAAAGGREATPSPSSVGSNNSRFLAPGARRATAHDRSHAPKAPAATTTRPKKKHTAAAQMNKIGPKDKKKHDRQSITKEQLWKKLQQVTLVSEFGTEDELRYRRLELALSKMAAEEALLYQRPSIEALLEEGGLEADQVGGGDHGHHHHAGSASSSAAQLVLERYLGRKKDLAREMKRRDEEGSSASDVGTLLGRGGDGEDGQNAMRRRRLALVRPRNRKRRLQPDQVAVRDEDDESESRPEQSRPRRDVDDRVLTTEYFNIGSDLGEEQEDAPSYADVDEFAPAAPAVDEVEGAAAAQGTTEGPTFRSRKRGPAALVDVRDQHAALLAAEGGGEADATNETSRSATRQRRHGMKSVSDFSTTPLDFETETDFAAEFAARAARLLPADQQQGIDIEDHVVDDDEDLISASPSGSASGGGP